jgi:hypothetical protein
MFKIRKRSLCFLGSDLIFGSEEGEGEERGGRGSGGGGAGILYSREKYQEAALI